MTRKDYEKFADLLSSELAVREGSAKVAVKAIICSTADIFAQDNERFDRVRFYKACGL